MVLKAIFFVLMSLLLHVKSQTTTCTASTFDLTSETGNGILNYILRWLNAANSQNTSISRVPTLIFRVTTMHSAAWFDCIAPYHSTQIGAIVDDIPKRPLNERTAINKHTCMLYATHKIWNKFYPGYKTSHWDRMLSCKNFDPLDLNEDLTTSIGIGNYIGRKQLEFWDNDGMNSLGYDDNRNYNPQPYKDIVTDYEPKNTAFKLKQPGNWQPNLIYNNFGVWTSQIFIGAQWSKLNTLTGLDPNDYTSSTPTKSKNYNDTNYLLQVLEVLNASSNLNDKQKMAAEWFDQKTPSLGSPITWEANLRNFTSEQYSHYHFTLHAAAYDAGIVAWKEKLRHDSVRPFSAVRYLFGDDVITAWGGPYKGTVHDITGNEWKSYINTGDHPEYPSGSSCFCHVHSQVAKKYFNTEYFASPYYTPNIVAGSSFTEPGIVPATTITLGPFPKFEDWAWTCGLSRLWAGVHFMDSIIEGKNLCEPIGDVAYQYVQSLINGEYTTETPISGDGSSSSE